MYFTVNNNFKMIFYAIISLNIAIPFREIIQGVLHLSIML